MSTRISILRGPVTTGDETRRIDQLIDYWARNTPQAPAVRALGEEMDYRELVHGAARVAAALTAEGVAPGDVVVVRLARGPALYQALLAVLKCGASYAAPDLAWPAARCARLVEQTGAGWFVGGGTPDSVEDGYAAGARALHFGALRACDLPFHPVAGGHDDAACVFLTSGSTGTPKAALVRHRSILRITRDPALGLGRAGSELCMLQAAPSPWDAFAMELWSPLVHGGTVVVHTGRHLEPHDVREAIAAGVNRIFLTTALFNVVADTDPAAFAGLSSLMVGGERASARHFNLAIAANPGLRLFHVYGPVESCVFTNAYQVPGEGLAGEVPIGHPVAGTTIYLLDDERRVVPRGEVGEIAVAGEGLALGYVNAEEPTLRAFPVLADLEPGADPVRVYLTGDRGRIDPDHGLVFLGRRDRQVKIRGMRIEPAEVEAAIAALPGVARVSVLPLPHGAQVRTHLAACVVPADPAGTCDESAIKKAVGAELPSAFVPDVVVSVADLPLTANGKVDQAALARIVENHRNADAAGRALSASGESLPEPVRAVVSFVAGHLRTPAGPDDDVFDAGGTSITAIQIAHWLTERAGRKVNAMQVMERGTPRRLAELLGEGRPIESATEPPTEPSTGSPAGPPSESASSEPSEQRWLAGLPVPQWRFWYLEVKNPGSGDTACPLEFRLRGLLDIPVLSAALRDVIGRHEALRTLLVRVGDRGVRPRVLDPAEVPDVLRRHTATSPEDAERLVDELLTTPFDLQREVPIRATVVSLSASEHLLAISVHHTAFDGWSADLLCRGLSAAYRAIVSGIPRPDTAPTRYAETWLEQDLRESERDRADLAAWSRNLLGVPDLPLVAEGALAPYGPTSEVWIDLPEPLRVAAETVAAEVGGSVQSVLLAAWARALRRLSGTEDLAIGIPVAGRTGPASREVIGCFASAVAARFRGAQNQDPEADLRTAQHELARALRFQFMPLELLLRSEAARDRTRNPFCQAGFVSQNNTSAELDLPGVRSAARRRLRERSSFELTLELWADENSLDVRIWYRTDVLSPSAARELAELWRTELEILTADRIAAGV